MGLPCSTLSGLATNESSLLDDGRDNEWEASLVRGPCASKPTAVYFFSYLGSFSLPLVCSESRLLW